MSPLPLLEGSLREVYLAPSHPLVPSFFEDRIYQASTWSGRIWKWILQFFLGEKSYQAKLERAIHKTQQIFKEQFETIQEHAQIYSNYLTLKTQNLHVDETQYHPSREVLRNWFRSTSPYTRKFVFTPHQNDPLDIAKELSKEELEKLQQIEALKPLLELESRLQAPIPLKIFYAIACKEPLKQEEEIYLDRWIRYCNEKRVLAPGETHRALEQFSAHMKNPSFDLIHLEIELTRMGLEVFSQEDPEQMQWRSSLKPGVQIETFQETITLGDSLGRKPFQEDRILIYAIKEYPHRVVWVPINPVLPLLKEYKRKECVSGISSAQCLAIDGEGRFAICERLSDALSDVQWQTHLDATQLNPVDGDILMPVANLLKWCVEHEATPQNFSPDHLMFNGNGTLTYARLCPLGHFSHTVLEDFILGCSKGHPTIYNFLMSASTLIQNGYSKFYHEIATAALEDKTISCSNIGSLYEIVDPKVIERAEQLYKAVKNMHQLCHETICQNYKIKDFHQLNRCIKEKIAEFYSKHRLGGKLWPNMEEAIIHHTIKVLNLEKISGK